MAPRCAPQSKCAQNRALWPTNILKLHILTDKGYGNISRKLFMTFTLWATYKITMYSTCELYIKSRWFN
jgi:hypothetical protein